MGAVVDLSVIVPAYNERGALPDLLDEVDEVRARLGRSSEVIVVDDGSTDGTFGFLQQLSRRRAGMRVIRLRRNFGKSAALAAGFEHSRGEAVVTIDGDGQDDPLEIPALLAKLEDGFDLVSGWKRERRDPALKRWSSRLFNAVTRRMSGLPLHDFNCGLKAYSGRCARSLELYSELHRFVPVLAAQGGWQVTEIPVVHRPRVHGKTKFGAERYLRGLFDLMTVLFIGRYRQRPMHLFGGIGLLLILVGVAISLYLTILKIGGSAIGQRPLLLLGAILIVVGAQFLTFGLLGQLIAALGHERSPTAGYQVASVIESTDAADGPGGSTAAMPHSDPSPLRAGE